MGSKSQNRQTPPDVHKLRRRLRSLDPAAPEYRSQRSRILADIQLAKSQLQRTPRTRQSAASTRTRRPASRRTSSTRRPAGKAGTPAATSDKKALSKLLSPKNLQESIKTVGNLRGMVKNWLQYLQQADQLLDTLFITSSSLKETGVLDKLVKSKGKNLNTEDFTNILMALMNTPMGAQLFKSGGGSEAEGETATETATASSKQGK